MGRKKKTHTHTHTHTPFTPESLENVSPLSRGLYIISACEYLHNVHISLFPRLFPPVQVLYYFYSRGLLLLSYSYSSSAPNHSTAAMAYVNQELTNTLVILISPRQPCGREEGHAMRCYSGGFGQRFLAIPSWAGRGFRDKMQVKLRADLASLYRLRIPDEPPRPESHVIATPCDLEFVRPGICVRSTLEKTFVLHI